MSNDAKNQKEKLLELIRAAVQQDHELREKYQVGEKFKFIRDRLNALAAHVEQNLAAMQVEAKKGRGQLTEDEMLVYVYLYNAQGLIFKTWEKMLNPSVFYEYSVNRPIYPDKGAVESFIRSRSNKVQHGFLTVVVKKTDILKSPENAKDPVGNPLIKVREGALDLGSLISFTYNGADYVIDDEGEIIKKE